MIEGNMYLFVMVGTAGRRGGLGFAFVQKCLDQVCFTVEIIISLCYFISCVLYFTMRGPFGVPCISTKRWSDFFFLEGCFSQP